MTSEGAAPSQHPVGLTAASSHCSGQVPGTGSAEPPGTLSVVNLAKAETDPAQSVTATVDAGYQPVRVITAGNGTQVWVTARASDDLLCFSAAQLTADPARALVAVVRVGSEPVGLAAVRDGTLIVTGDLATGQFPRDMAVSPGGTLLVADYISGQVQAIATAHL